MIKKEKTISNPTPYLLNQNLQSPPTYFLSPPNSLTTCQFSFLEPFPN